MRRLRRAHRKQQRQKSKPYSRFRSGALTAGTVAAIALAGQARSEIKTLANGPDPHQTPVAQDADADLLADNEELAIGYKPFEADQNRNEILDGIELAKRCCSAMGELPRYFSPGDVPPGLTEPYVVLYFALGYEYCDACGEQLEMGVAEVINPKLGVTAYCSFIGSHYLGHGSFSYAAGSETGRVDVQRLMAALEMRLPYEPNEHQLPLDYVVEPAGQLAPDANDADADLLADSEELGAGTNLDNPDQDQDLVPDGIELARQCASVIEGLSFWPDPDDPNKPYIEHWPEFGLETCDICGATVNMGPAWIVNPRLGLKVDCPLIAAHYMSHGSFSYAGDVNPPGRIDIGLLLEALEMPRRCGHLGTLYLRGDLNRDCDVNLADFGEFAADWLKSTDPSQAGPGE